MSGAVSDAATRALVEAALELERAVHFLTHAGGEPRRVAFYDRASTVGQARNALRDAARQDAPLVCAALGWELVGAPPFLDVCPGDQLVRPAFAAALLTTANAIAAFDFDRFARGGAEMRKIMMMAGRHRKTLCVVNARLVLGRP